LRRRREGVWMYHFLGGFTSFLFLAGAIEDHEERHFE